MKLLAQDTPRRGKDGLKCWGSFAGEQCHKAWGWFRENEVKERTDSGNRKFAFWDALISYQLLEPFVRGISFSTQVHVWYCLIVHNTMLIVSRICLGSPTLCFNDQFKSVWSQNFVQQWCFSSYLPEMWLVLPFGSFLTFGYLKTDDNPSNTPFKLSIVSIDNWSLIQRKFQLEDWFILLITLLVHVDSYESEPPFPNKRPFDPYPNLFL